MAATQARCALGAANVAASRECPLKVGRYARFSLPSSPAEDAPDSFLLYFPAKSSPSSCESIVCMPCMPVSSEAVVPGLVTADQGNSRI